MQTELITDWPEFSKLEREWPELLGSSFEDSLFLTWDWLWSWAQLRADQVSPFVVVVRDGQGKLVGVAPFYLARMSLISVVGYKTLRIIGDHASAGEYGNIIAERSNAIEIKSRILQVLCEHTEHWDLIWMHHLNGWDEGFTSLREAMRTTNKLGHATRVHAFSTLDLADEQHFLQRKPARNLRSNLKRIANSLARAGEIEIKQCRRVDDLPRYLETLHQLHQARWLSIGELGSFARDPDVMRFYLRFATRALENGWLRLYLLECDGVPRACQIGYVYKSVFYVIQEGFDPEFAAGVGNHLRSHVLHECIAEQVREYDFLGGFSEHKRRWGAVERTGSDLLAWNDNLKNWLFDYKNPWPTGRFLKSVEP